MGVNISEKTYKNYGKCVFLDNGIITIGVTVEIGPRVIYFSLNGKENVMLEDIDRNFTEDTADYGTWVNYGGHRLWVAPEVNPETYYPDNAPVGYDFSDDTLTLTPPATPFGKQMTIIIQMDASAPVAEVTSKIKNISDKPSEYAAWSITGLTDGGVCVVPVNTRETGYLANRVLSLWDYTDISDSRFRMTNAEYRIKQDKFVKKAFKIGFNLVDGFAAYAVNEQIFVKIMPPYKEVRYPDYSCNSEVYTNSRFLECEHIGEMRSYAPGEEAVVTEWWVMLDNTGDIDPKIESIRNAVKDRMYE